jgi:hypothetical protein
MLSTNRMLLAAIGETVAAHANAGALRLRGALVETMAYQAYSAMLGERLSAALVQTGDLDIAQLADVSVAINDMSVQIADVLRRVNPPVRPIPHPRGRSTLSRSRQAKVSG